MKKRFDVFISYRRKGGGFETANLLHDRLTQAGYRGFMDVENLRSGKFNEQLYQQIDSCKDFIVVLGPESLDRCKNDDDWLRLEIAHALEKHKNIVPVFLRGFKFPEESLPADINELRNYEGIEASHELFNAFLEKLKRLLQSKRHITWSRIKKQLLFILLPVFILSATLFFVHHYNREKEQNQLEQVCTEIVSNISAGFAGGNILIGIIQEVNNEWKKYHNNIMNETNPQEKERLKSYMFQFLYFKSTQIKEKIKLPEIRLTDANEELLARYKISTQDVKGAKILFEGDKEETLDFLASVRRWVDTPEYGLPDEIDEALDKLARMNIEMINGGLYSFNALLIEMPKKSQEEYNKFLPMMTNYTAEINFHDTKSNLEAKMQRSLQKCEALLLEFAAITGNENMKIKKMENDLEQFKQLKESMQTLTVNYNPKVDSIRGVIAEKKEILEQRRAEIDDKKQEVRAGYQRILEKCSFEKEEDQWMMWGKILRLVQFGHAQLIIENNSKAENERLREEARKSGQNSDAIAPITATIASKEVFQEVQKRLDLYLSYNNSSDPNAAVYIPAVKQYYTLVSERQQDPVGVLIVGTQDDLPHPLLQTGDIVVEKKGETVDRVDVYFDLNKKEEENKQKIIRFTDGKKTEITGTIPPDCKVLVGVLHLWKEK